MDARPEVVAQLAAAHRGPESGLFHAPLEFQWSPMEDMRAHLRVQFHIRERMG